MYETMLRMRPYEHVDMWTISTVNHIVVICNFRFYLIHRENLATCQIFRAHGFISSVAVKTFKANIHTKLGT